MLSKHLWNSDLAQPLLGLNICHKQLGSAPGVQQAQGHIRQTGKAGTEGRRDTSLDIAPPSPHTQAPAA